jgi:hypothetical protein
MKIIAMKYLYFIFVSGPTFEVGKLFFEVFDVGKFILDDINS